VPSASMITLSRLLCFQMESDFMFDSCRHFFKQQIQGSETSVLVREELHYALKHVSGDIDVQ
jgi:hypothetical protein